MGYTHYFTKTKKDLSENQTDKIKQMVIRLASHLPCFAEPVIDPNAVKSVSYAAAGYRIGRIDNDHQQMVMAKDEEVLHCYFDAPVQDDLIVVPAIPDFSKITQSAAYSALKERLNLAITP